MKILVLDIGNTEIKFGLFINGQLEQNWRAEYIKNTASQAASLLELCQRHISSNILPLDRIVYSNVVLSLEEGLRLALRRASELADEKIIALKSDEFELPVDFSLYQAGQLGEDRLVNACGAFRLYPQENLVIVDFGTATTFDLVCAEGIYRGGAIAPGLRTFADSLAEKAPRLPKLDLRQKTFKAIGIGLNTETCLEAGLGFGYRGLVRELLNASRQALLAINSKVPAKVIATGGLAEIAIQFCGLQADINVIDRSLTLKALAHIYKMQFKS